jgi:hypothetical protein
MPWFMKFISEEKDKFSPQPQPLMQLIVSSQDIAVVVVGKRMIEEYLMGNVGVVLVMVFCIKNH